MATTFVPTYSALAGAVVPRGGVQTADIAAVWTTGPDGATLALGRDARGGPALATGADRLLGRIARALVTPQGAAILNPDYGTAAVPGALLTQSVPLQVADAAQREAAITQGSPLGAAGRVLRVAATARRDAIDPTTVDVDVTITTADGASVSGQFAGLGG